MEDLPACSAKPRLRLLLDHFAKIKYTRQAWKVAYPLREVLFLVVCGTIASGDDYDDIVDWGEAHLAPRQLRRRSNSWARRSGPSAEANPAKRDAVRMHDTQKPRRFGSHCN